LTSTLAFPGQSEVEVVLGRSWSRIRLRTRKWLPGPTVDGLLRGETSGAGRYGGPWSSREKGRISTPDPRQDKIGFVLDIGV
jgi:hypothetical protein